MKAVVVAHGEAEDADRRHLAGADLVIAADGGALLLERWGIRPSVVIGDLDGLGSARAAALERIGVTVVRAPTTKDETDTELAMAHALARGASEIVLIAGFGGPRDDHALANALLLADARLRGIVVCAVRGATTVRAVFGGDRLVLRGGPGDVVSLLPVGGDATGVTTEGLRYPLKGDTLRIGAARGVSNLVERVPASVTLGRGTLLVFEIPDGGAA
ncbi:MAG TPA: thiamine diphosphokinase [Candidatus Limnocylindria bacterium]|nr:thiamine diphosphokinase [Candidatus Limnocylindria bacterium]